MRGQAQDALKAGAWSISESRERLRSREAIVGAEVAISTALLIVGGLLGVSFFRLMSVERGFETQHVLTQDLSLGAPRYPDTAGRVRFIDDALREIRRIPGVEAAGATSQLPLHGETWVDMLATPETAGNDKDAPPANFRFTSPGYWTAMGVALKQGRLIEESDRGRNVVLLSESAARRLWPDGAALGKTVRRGGSQRPWMEVAGVVADARTGLAAEPPVLVYEPNWVETPPAISLAVRTKGDPLAAASGLRQVLGRLDPELPLPQVRTMETIVADSVAPRRFYLQLSISFALAALLLTAIGIYGVIAYSALRRTRELGIRLALGAQPSGVTRMVLTQGMLPVAVGLAVGVALAMGASRLIESQLFGVQPGDPVTMAAVAVLIALAALAACWLPAWRASRLNPVDALRAE
jgi:putative ABC transport system permease protein